MLDAAAKSREMQLDYNHWVYRCGGMTSTKVGLKCWWGKTLTVYKGENGKTL